MRSLRPLLSRTGARPSARPLVAARSTPLHLQPIERLSEFRDQAGRFRMIRNLDVEGEVADQVSDKMEVQPEFKAVVDHSAVALQQPVRHAAVLIRGNFGEVVYGVIALIHPEVDDAGQASDGSKKT